MKPLMRYSFKPRVQKKYVQRGALAQSTASLMGITPREAAEVQRRSIFFGVELELPGPSREFLLESVGSVDDSEADVFYCKVDGSIPPTGVEVVSQPATERYHLHHMGWNLLWDKLESRLPEVREADFWAQCGMHVHVGRDFGGVPDADKYLAAIRFYGLCRYLLDAIEDLAGRPANHFAQAMPSIYGLSQDGLVKSSLMPLRSRNRYRVLNTANAKTLEFRLCAAPHNRLEFWQRLELVWALAGFSLIPYEGVQQEDRGGILFLSFPTGTRLTAEDFFGWVAVQKRRFPHLYELCVEKGFIRPLYVREDGQVWLPFVDELELSEEEIRRIPRRRPGRPRRRVAA